RDRAAVLLGDGLEFAAHAGNRSFPRHGRLSGAVEASQRLIESLSRVDVGVVEAPLVADEISLRFWILARADAVDDVLVVIDVNATAGRAAGTDALGLVQKPDALLVEEFLVRQRTDGAQVDDISGERIVDRVAGKNVDLGMMAAIGDGQFSRAGDF